MKKSIIYIALAISVIANIVFLFIILRNTCSIAKTNGTDFSDKEKLQEAAEAAVKKYVCDDLYYPDSYDPVTTQVDSAFYNYLTDTECFNAALKLIDLRTSYDEAKETYENNDWTIRFHGNVSGPFLEHEREARAESAKKMKDLQEEIEVQQNIIKNRDTSRDGEFLGWVVEHKYRASNSNGVVSFGEVLYIFDPEMKNYYFRFSLDKNYNKNLYSIKETIETELGI